MLSVIFKYVILPTCNPYVDRLHKMYLKTSLLLFYLYTQCKKCTHRFQGVGLNISVILKYVMVPTCNAYVDRLHKMYMSL